MESTGVCWKPLYNLFELMGLEVAKNYVNVNSIRGIAGAEVYTTSGLVIIVYTNRFVA